MNIRCLIQVFITLASPVVVVAQAALTKNTEQELLYAASRIDSAAVKSSAGQTDPCQLALAVAGIVTQVARTDVFQSTLRSLNDSLRIEPAKEYIIGFGREADGTILASPVSNGSRSSATIPPVAGAFADLHNHPKNTPPSSGDVYGLLWKNRKAAGYTLRFVLTTDALYALVVYDTAAAARFLQRYPPLQMAGYSPLFPDSLLNEYRELKYVHHIAEDAAMAFILEKYNTGVWLLKQEKGTAFRKLSLSQQEIENGIRQAHMPCR